MRGTAEFPDETAVNDPEPHVGRAWDTLPDRLANTARQIAEEVHQGHTRMALDLVDGVLTELTTRRDALARELDSRG